MKESRKEKHYNSDKFKKKKKKKHKKHEPSSSSDSEDAKGQIQWVEASPPHNANAKKEKKKKKHKKKKHRSSSSSDSESSSCEAPIVESPPANLTAEKRDSWMCEESFVPTLSKDEMLLSRSHQKRNDSLKKKLEKEEEIKNNRELNPHWRKSGTGLPDKEADVESLSLPSTSVGDGGYSWLKKAYYRIQEQAQIEGRSMEEVAVERWGSLSKLESMIKEAEDRMKTRPDHRHSGRNRDGYDRCNERAYSGRFKKPHDNYKSDSHSFDSPFEFRKPSDSNKDRKSLNQFKSSRKPYSYEPSDKVKENKISNFSSDSKYTNEIKSGELRNKFENLKSSSDRECRIPAWKKPKFAEEKHKEKEIFEEPIKETSNFEPRKANVMMDSTSVEDGMPVCGDEDLSRLAAKQIKAEIRGETTLALKLKQQLDEARQIIKEKGFAKRPPKQTEEVILTKIDSHGQIHPIQVSQDKIADYKQKKSNKCFDDDKYSLKQMFEREKLTTVNDQMEMFVEATAKCDDTKEIDFELGNVSKKIIPEASNWPR